MMENKTDEHIPDAVQVSMVSENSIRLSKNDQKSPKLYHDNIP